MIVLVFRAARRNDSQGLRERFTGPKAANAEAAKLRPRETISAKAEVDSALREELKGMTDLLREKDSTITELENSLSGKQQLLQNHSKELDGLKSKVNVLTDQLTDLRLAKERAESLLQQELKKTKVLLAKDSVITGLENNLTATQELLQTRSRELKAAKSKVNTLRERLTALGTAKKQTENVLQQQLKQKTELLEAKDAAMKELQESLSTSADCAFATGGGSKARLGSK